MKKGSLRDIAFYAIIVLILIGTISALMNMSQPEHLNYSQVVRLFRQEQVRSFVYSNGTLTLELADSSIRKHQLFSFPVFFEELNDLISDQFRRNIIVEYDYEPRYEPPWWLMMLPYLILFGIIIALWYFMFNRAGGGGGENNRAMRFGRARTRLGTDEKKKITFNDVAGADEEKGELQEIVDFLKDPRRYVDIGARVPKGVLLVGPPGTGKTYIAKAVAGEAGVQFLSISGSDFVELYVGVGASRVRDLFEQAKKVSPSIVFIDEIDAVGRQRGAGMGGGHDEREQTLNQMLVEMDGFGTNEGVIIIAATNRPDILDPALLRPGRFDRQVYVGLPDIKGREAILHIHSRAKPLDAAVDLNTIAKSTAGFTPADLENLLNEAALLAARRNRRVISMKDIEAATIKVIAGPEKKSKVVREHDRRLFAYHEAGHAVVVKSLKTHDPVHQISIVPRGMAGGMNIFLPKEDKSSMSRTEMLERLTSCLGGRVAEQLILGDISTGASNDIKKATEIARNMVTKYGMSEKLGPVLYGSDNEVFLGRDYGHMRNYSDSVANLIDDEIKAFIKDAYKRCEEILSQNVEKLHGVAKYLLENETMDGAAFEAYMDTGDLPDPVPEPPQESSLDAVLSDLPILDELPELEEDDE